MSRPCLSKFIISTWILVYVAAIVIVQLLLRSVPNYTNEITTALMYVITSLVFGLRLWFCKEKTPVEKVSAFADGCPIDAFSENVSRDDTTKVSDDEKMNQESGKLTLLFSKGKEVSKDQKGEDDTTGTTDKVAVITEKQDVSKDTSTSWEKSASHDEDKKTSDAEESENATSWEKSPDETDEVDEKEVVISVSAPETKQPLPEWAQPQPPEDKVAVTIDVKEAEPIQNETPTPLPQNRTRIPFLDSVKIFLTLLVVTHNTMCAFGGCKQGSWYLVIGKYQNSFGDYCSMITTMNQAYFMPLFYLISAYFTPASYARKGKTKFMRDRARRLYIPAIFVSFTLSPISSIIGQIVSRSGIMYFPTPGPAWFSFWLLVFNWMYSTITESKPQTLTDEIIVETSTSSSEEEEEELKSYPGIIKRWLIGFLFCGLTMFGFAFAVSGFPYFYTMPVSYGSSFINNILFFTVGIYASKYKWLSSSHAASKQLREEVWPLIYITAFIEAVLIIGLSTLMDGMQEGGKWLPFLIVGFFLLTGVFCVDMSMVVLHFFNKYGSLLNSLGIFLSKNAYAVYLIHPIIITSLTAIFVRVYNSLNGGIIEFEGVVSKTELLGPGKGGLHLFYGFFIVWIVTQVLSWSIAAFLRGRKLLKGIL